MNKAMLLLIVIGVIAPVTATRAECPQGSPFVNSIGAGPAVEGNYEKILGRAPAQSEFDYWYPQILCGRLTYYKMALEFYQSPEGQIKNAHWRAVFYRLRENHGHLPESYTTDIVYHMYGLFLRRTPQTPELNAWRGLIPHISFEVFAAMFASSQESLSDMTFGNSNEYYLFPAPVPQ